MYSVRTNNFRKDLSFGKKFERMAFQYFQGYDRVVYAPEKCKTHDVTFYNKGTPCMVEVKADRWTQRTGNLAIEYNCSGKDSGILVTKADYWLHFCVNDGDKPTVYKIPINDLKKIITEGYRTHQLRNKTKALVYLVPQERVAEYEVRPTKELIDNSNIRE
jgi:signal transduction histidine kinase